MDKKKRNIHLKLSIKCDHWTYLFWNKDQYQAENVISDEEKKSSEISISGKRMIF